MQGQYYPDVFSREGITLITPGVKEQVYIHDKYMNELVNGVILSETRERLLAIVERLKAQEGIEGLILGGTELPLILPQESYNGIPFLDTAKIHVECAISQMLS
jgi:aspartate racemase